MKKKQTNKQKQRRNIICHGVSSQTTEIDKEYQTEDNEKEYRALYSSYLILSV